MEVPGGAEEGFIREWAPCTHILNLIPARIQTGIFSSELCLTCVDAVSEYIALGTNVGLVYWYDRKKGTIQKLRCELSSSPITFVKIANTVDYMVGAGNEAGQVTVFQVPKQHPDNIPEHLKPKVEPKVERYTIGDLHKGKVTYIEWSKNGMRLFSGDTSGIIIMTEIDFYMHLCKSLEIVNEGHEIVQLSYCRGYLLVSSLYRCIICERKDGRWTVTQIGKKDRKSLCALGAVLWPSGAAGAPPEAYCARPGARLWRADVQGNVLQTMLFKDAISNPLTIAELLNPRRDVTDAHSLRAGHSLRALHVFRSQFLLAEAREPPALLVLQPRRLAVAAAACQLRGILSVSVSACEVFVLEGARSLVRLAAEPEPPPPEILGNSMTKSLTSSIQQAVNTVRGFTHIDQTVPYISSILEQPIALLTGNEVLDHTVVNAEECFELPPIKNLPTDIPTNLLESIVKDGKDELAEQAQDLQKKLELYTSIERRRDAELIYSRRSRRREASSREASPRATRDASYTSPCAMDVSLYDKLPDHNDEILEKQIEEKEKILAKLLNLESLSIKMPETAAQEQTTDNEPFYKHVEVTPVEKTKDKPAKDYHRLKTNNAENSIHESSLLDTIPKIMQLPNNWNLENIELRLDLKTNGLKYSHNLTSPDDTLESDWEIV